MTFSLPAYWFAGSSEDDDQTRVPPEGRGRRTEQGTERNQNPRESNGTDRRLGIADLEIAQRIRDGDELLFGRLFDTYWGPLTRFAALYTRSDDEAQDVAAQVFAAVWQGRHSWTPKRGVELYLYGAARNRARNVHRSLDRAERQVASLMDDGESPTTGSVLLRPDHAVVADERRTILLRAVNSLTERTREVLLLRWLRGLDFEEIAALLGLSRNAVYVSYHRAIAQLRDRLPEYFE
jgi:RNA polymerase sigma factor (sigma-70 family)